MNVLSWLRLAIVNWHQLVLFLVGTSGHLGAFLIAQLIKNPPAMRETWVRCLGWEDPLEKGKASHSSILAWRIPWTVQFMQLQSQDTTERLSLSFSLEEKWVSLTSLHFWTLKVRVRSFINSYPSLKWQFPGPLWSLLMPEFEEILPISPSIHSSIHPTSHPFT